MPTGNHADYRPALYTENLLCGIINVVLTADHFVHGAMIMEYVLPTVAEHVLLHCTALTDARKTLITATTDLKVNMKTTTLLCDPRCQCVVERFLLSILDKNE